MKKSEVHILQTLILLVSLILLVGRGSQGVSETAPTPTQATSPIATPVPETTPSEELPDIPGLDAVSTLADAAPTRTPQPTATPDAITEVVETIAQGTGLVWAISIYGVMWWRSG